MVEEVGEVDVTEVYSPPRIPTMAKRLGMSPGEAMDILTGWDFGKKRDRKRAEEKIRNRNQCS